MKITIREEGKYTAPGEGVGVFFEDLNYDLDGGLYAEMLENRNFEAKDVHGEWDNYIVENDGGYGWTPTGEGVALKIKSPALHRKPALSAPHRPKGGRGRQK